MRSVWRDCPHCQEERLTVTLTRAEAELLVGESGFARGGVSGKLYNLLRRQTGLTLPTKSKGK